MNTWKVDFHPLANKEVQKFDLGLQAKLTRIIDMIEVNGLQNVGMPYVRPIEGKLWEMRVKGKDNIARALYVAIQGQRVIVLHAFIKKTQETPLSAINLAWQRFKELEQ